MRALVKATRDKGLVMQELPIPEIGPNDVLIRIHLSAICDTDMHIWNWDAWSQRTVPLPMAVGHEYVGVIEKIGEAVGQPLADRADDGATGLQRRILIALERGMCGTDGGIDRIKDGHALRVAGAWVRLGGGELRGDDGADQAFKFSIVHWSFPRDKPTIAASAICISCSTVPPLIPSPPAIRPARYSG